MDVLKKISVIFLLCCVFIFPGKGQLTRFRIFRNLTRMPTMSEIMNNYVMKNGQRLNITLISQSADGATDKISVNGGEEADFAAPDECGPRYTSVPLPRDPDQMALIFPECTRALRCSGCCASEFRSCQPVAVSQRKVKVLKLLLEHPNAENFNYDSEPDVLIEDHQACMEQCIVKASDCTPQQTYYEYDCRCACNNQVDCPADQNQRWNERTCRCECIEETPCEGYAIFNRETCSCESRSSVGGISDEDLDEFNQINNEDSDNSDQTTTTSAPSTTTTTTTTTTPTTTTTTSPLTITCPPGWILGHTNGVLNCAPDFSSFFASHRRRRRDHYVRRRTFKYN